MGFTGSSTHKFVFDYDQDMEESAVEDDLMKPSEDQAAADGTVSSKFRSVLKQ